MSTLEEKTEARKQLWIKAEAERMNRIKEAQHTAEIISPTVQAMMRSMVDTAVDKVKVELLLEMEAEIKRVVKEQVDDYCNKAFDTTNADEHFHMVREQSDEPTFDTRANSPSIEEDRFVLSDPPVMKRGETGWEFER